MQKTGFHLYKILLVEDDVLYAETLVDFLSDDNFSIQHVKSHNDALEALYVENFDIYILDINLEKSNGIELLDALRKSNDKKPALFLTSDSSSATAVECFRVGCDDYIRKHCDMSEIAERIKLTIKKSYPQQSTLIDLGNGCNYYISEKVLIQDGKTVDLSQKEIVLLELLLKNKGNLVGWEEIASALWSPSETVSFASVRVYINTLKKLLGKDTIKNIKGVGYKLSF